MAIFTEFSGFRSLITVCVLGLAWLLGFSSRLFSVIRYESIIHEFDPWFNYRSTAHMVANGFYDFLNWFDDQAWYPLGRIVGGTVFPGLMITSGAVHYVLSLLNLPVHIREICVFLAPAFSGLTSIATYLLTKELWNARAGLFAACFMAVVPGYISRSVAGSYDNEGIAIFALMLTYFLWVKSVKSGSVFWAALTALSYFYMVGAWGGYVFIINLVPLHVFVLLLMQRYSSRLYIAYTTFYALGLILSMQIPFVGFQPIRTSEHMASAGVFVLLQACAFLRYVQSSLSSSQFRHLFVQGSAVAAGCVFVAVVALTYCGYVAPWSGRFYSLWDTNYARVHLPIISSVSEHQPASLISFFIDLHILACAYPIGAWLCCQEPTDERVFIVLYAVCATYFARVMVRLMLTLAPCVCVLAAVAFSKLLDSYLKDEPEQQKQQQQQQRQQQQLQQRQQQRQQRQQQPQRRRRPGEPDDDELLGVNMRLMVVTVVAVLMFLFSTHCTWVTSNAYSSPSVVLALRNGDGSRRIVDDFREAYFWLRRNTRPSARVMAWWDYGYQIAGMANRTTLVDNNTWNNTHIALVGRAMASNESEAYKIMRSLDVDYVLIVFGGLIGYSGDDINKFLWMVRIAQGEFPQDVRERDFFTPRGQYRVDSEAPETMTSSLMYRMSYYRFGDVQADAGKPAGFDLTRNSAIGVKDYELRHLEEAFTTENWMVRIFRVKRPSNRERVAAGRRVEGASQSRKTPEDQTGVVGHSPRVVKGAKPLRCP